jgi:hypothetical protein
MKASNRSIDPSINKLMDKQSRINNKEDLYKNSKLERK